MPKWSATELQTLWCNWRSPGTPLWQTLWRKQKCYKNSAIKAWGTKILQSLKALFWSYTADKSTVKGQWIPALQQAALFVGTGSAYSETQIWKQAKEFLPTHKILSSRYGAWNQSRINTDEELAQEINLYLQAKGKYVKAEDICQYLNQPEVKERWGFKKNNQQIYSKASDEETWV